MMQRPSVLRSTLSLVAVAVGCVGLAGCSSTALSPGKSVLDVQAARDSSALAVSQSAPSFPSHPSGFDWANRTLKASGQGSAAPGMPRAQQDVAASTSAAAHARASLKEQVRALPVGTDQTVGSIMNTYGAIRLSVEREIESARVTNTKPGINGTAEAEVELPMQGIANILQQYTITPDQELPAPNAAGVSNII